MATRAAIYLRVSRGDQTIENQRPDVERVVETRRLELVTTYEEKVSAAKVRPQFDKMMRDAHRGAFDMLIVWAIDRFGRSMVGNLQAVLELDRVGVQVVSVREPWLDTGGAVRPLLIAIFSWVAEQERAHLVERTKAGIARALRDEGLSLREVAKKLRVPATTLHRALGRSKKGGSGEGS